MKRPKVDFANWHVTARGARRLLLFHAPEDYKVFYALLGECCRDAKVELVADCLMSNHFHLALGGGTTQLTRCMQRLNRAYSGYHNERYGLSGHAFDREYYGEAIPSDFILKRVVRYIHLNPVRGGQSTKPELYEWSSYTRMISSASTVLGNGEISFLSAFDEHLATAQERYRAFTERDLLRRIPPPIGRTPAWEIWQEQFSWFLDFLMEQEDFLQPLRPEEAAVYFGSRIGIPPRAMGRCLNQSDGRGVSEMLRNLKRRFDRNPQLISKLDSLRIL